MILEHMRSAMRSLWGNKLRTFLSMIGIVIGVGSVVAITALGESARASITSQIAQAGLETITVNVGRRPGAAVERLFTDDLVEELARFEGIKAAAAVNRASAQLKAGAESASEQITSATPAYLDIFSLEVKEGRFVTEADMLDRSAVVVLGSELAETLFPDGGAVGSAVRVLGSSPKQLRVIGVLETRSDTFGFSFDSGAFMPRSSFLVRIAKPARPESFVLWADPDARDVVETAAGLQAWFDAETGTDNAVRVQSPSTIAETMSGVTDTLSGFLAGIAAISLVVGGIGIMNIMLVSVTERTREIGIRKALGATPAAIRVQFLVEAIYITLAGGFIGLALGMAVSKVASGFLGWDFILAPSSMAVAVVFSAATGIFFGLYPAARAARLDPVVALSYE
ncbi:MAG TPA: ABC transporter permease [Spirochaetales bacterium]|nr:ABC transporter permease [Spirochaetales bacterium]